MAFTNFTLGNELRCKPGDQDKHPELGYLHIQAIPVNIHL